MPRSAPVPLPEGLPLRLRTQFRITRRLTAVLRLLGLRESVIRARGSLLRARRRAFERRGSARYSTPALHDMDRQLDRIIDQDGGVFVEAGGYDGFTQSNTYYLERFRAWSGVLVEPMPKPAHTTGLSAPLRALKHRGLLTMSLTALCYNWAFFTVLGYAPFPMALSPIKLGLVFTGWGIFVAIFAVFGAPRLQASLGIAKTMYANLAAFAVVVLVIAIWTTDRAVLIPAVIISGIFIGVNNTVTTQAVMTVSPVEKPVASAAYSFVRFIGGGLAPYAAGRMVLAINIHFPFYIAVGAILAGIVILTTAHGLLSQAERVQAEQVTGSPAAAGEPEGPGPVGALIPVEAGPVEASTEAARPGARVILAAVDASPAAALVTEAAGVLAADHGGVVHVVHTQEEAITGDVAIDGESLDTARAVVRNHLDRLAAHHVPAEGQILLHAADHGAAGRMVAEYASTVGASTIVVGAPTHGGLPALMDGSASRELWRHARSNVLVVNPDAPAGVPAEDLWREPAKD